MSTEPGAAPLSLPRRLAWFVAIWAASVGSLGVVAWLLRTLLKP